jgi:hypothetical protein
MIRKSKRNQYNSCQHIKQRQAADLQNYQKSITNRYKGRQTYKTAANRFFMQDYFEIRKKPIRTSPKYITAASRYVSK